MTKNCKHLFHLQFALAKKYRKFVENKKSGLYTLGLSVIAKEHSDCGNLLACCSVGDSHARFSRSE